jgi:hypothetical protein
LKKALFRKGINSAMSKYRSTTSEIIRENAPNPVRELEAQRLLSRITQTNSQRYDGRSFSDKFLHELANFAVNPNKEYRLANLHKTKGEAVKDIQIQSKLRKTFPRGTLRLIHAGSKARTRLKRMRTAPSSK